MKRRTVSGSCAVGLFMISFICVFIAFATPSWIVSDYRITGAKLDRLGLWTHCFRSLADPNDDYNRRFFVGCRWVYDPFTSGYDEIRGFLMPRKYPIFIITILFFIFYLLTFNFSIHDCNTILLYIMLYRIFNRFWISDVLLPLCWT